MRILGISGGTKNGRNDCVCKEALRAAVDSGAEIEFIHLLDLDIKHCTGCRVCMANIMQGKGNGCVLKDDFDWLLDRMLDADGIVFSIPIFECCASGVFHTIMDRFGPRLDRGNNLMAAENAKKSGGSMPDLRILKDKPVSYIAIGGSDWMTSVENDFAIQSMTPMWKIIDREVFQWASTLIVDEERMARVYEIGKNLAEAAKDVENAVYKGEPGVCGHCHSRQFYLRPDGMAVCGSCGIEGELKKCPSGYIFSYDSSQELLAHDTLSGKQKHGMDIAKNTEMEMQMMQSDKYRSRREFYKNFLKANTPAR